MSKSSKQIEEDAIDYLKLALKKSKHINREISKGDREPIWDGRIYFYHFKNILFFNTKFYNIIDTMTFKTLLPYP